jgi:hypothetical protein
LLSPCTAAAGLASPVDKDRKDYTIFSGAWGIGRIYEQRGGPDHMRWFWSLYGMFGKPVEIRTDDRDAAFEAWADGYSASEYATAVIAFKPT